MDGFYLAILFLAAHVAIHIIVYAIDQLGSVQIPKEDTDIWKGYISRALKWILHGVNINALDFETYVQP